MSDRAPTRATWRQPGATMFVTTSDARRRHRFLVEPLQESGIDPVLIEDRGSLLSLLSYARQTFKRYPRIALVVLCDADVRMLIWALAAKWFSSAKIVVRVGGDPVKVRDDKISALKRMGDKGSVRRMRLQQWASRKLFARADAYITVSEKLKNDLRILAPTIPAAAIPQVVNLDRPVRQDFALGEPMQILTVTNLSYAAKFEGVKTLVGFLDQFVQTHGIRVEFTVLGGGAFEQPLVDWLGELKSSQLLTVNVKGFVDDPGPYYQSADLFVYYSNLEGLPNVVLEAQASGLPLLINDDPLFFEFLEEGKHVLFFGQDAGGAFSSKLASLMQSQEMRASLGQANRLCAEERYSKTAVTHRLEGFFDRL